MQLTREILRKQKFITIEKAHHTHTHNPPCRHAFTRRSLIINNEIRLLILRPSCRRLFFVFLPPFLSLLFILSLPVEKEKVIILLAAIISHPLGCCVLSIYNDLIYYLMCVCVCYTAETCLFIWSVVEWYISPLNPVPTHRHTHTHTSTIFFLFFSYLVSSSKMICVVAFIFSFFFFFLFCLRSFYYFLLLLYYITTVSVLCVHYIHVCCLCVMDVLPRPPCLTFGETKVKKKER